MTIEELEEALKNYTITKPTEKDKQGKDRSLPFMLATFRKLIVNEVPPTQKDFMDLFAKTYPSIDGVSSRLTRAYLSYVREYHLGYLLRKHFKNVKYNEQIDLSGVDFVITYKRCVFNIHAFVDTPNGRYWRSVKEDRHDFKGIHIDLPLDLSFGKRVGDFIFYTDTNITKLKKEMSSVVLERGQIGKKVSGQNHN